MSANHVSTRQRANSPLNNYSVKTPCNFATSTIMFTPNFTKASRTVMHSFWHCRKEICWMSGSRVATYDLQEHAQCVWSSWSLALIDGFTKHWRFLASTDSISRKVLSVTTMKSSNYNGYLRCRVIKPKLTCIQTDSWESFPKEQF